MKTGNYTVASYTVVAVVLGSILLALKYLPKIKGEMADPPTVVYFHQRPLLLPIGGKGGTEVKVAFSNLPNRNYAVDTYLGDTLLKRSFHWLSDTRVHSFFVDNTQNPDADTVIVQLLYDNEMVVEGKCPIAYLAEGDTATVDQIFLREKEKRLHIDRECGPLELHSMIHEGDYYAMEHEESVEYVEETDSIVAIQQFHDFKVLHQESNTFFDLKSEIGYQWKLPTLIGLYYQHAEFQKYEHSAKLSSFAAFRNALVSDSVQLYHHLDAYYTAQSKTVKLNKGRLEPLDSMVYPRMLEFMFISFHCPEKQ